MAGIVGLGAAMVVVGGSVTPGGQGQLITVLVTGITTGGLSCMAVQGGLLASTLAPADGSPPPASPARTILAFLAAKLVAYTLLGALLGLLGSVAQLSIGARGTMQIAIGFFMLATGVRMLYPHPWLNFLALEPPASVRRMIRKRSRTSDGDSTAVFLGALTVLIPCGITQAMMAIAITTGSPLAGALVMALFTLGTSPVFFALSFAASSIGRHAQQVFNRAVGVLILILGYVAIQTGFMLVGHPLPVRPVFVGLTPKSDVVRAEPASGGLATIDVRVAKEGYRPDRIETAADRPINLRFITKGITGCTRTVNIAKTGLQKSLPVTGSTTIKIPAQPSGTVVRWVCGMGMYTGSVTFTKERAK